MTIGALYSELTGNPAARIRGGDGAASVAYT
jgi:hypothetical protein